MGDPPKSKESEATDPCRFSFLVLCTTTNPTCVISPQYLCEKTFLPCAQLVLIDAGRLDAQVLVDPACVGRLVSAALNYLEKGKSASCSDGLPFGVNKIIFVIPTLYFFLDDPFHWKTLLKHEGNALKDLWRLVVFFQKHKSKSHLVT